MHSTRSMSATYTSGDIGTGTYVTRSVSRGGGAGASFRSSKVVGASEEDVVDESNPSALLTELHQKDSLLSHLQEELKTVKSDRDGLEKLFEGSQIENQRCHAQATELKEYIKILEKQLMNSNGIHWRETLNIPPTPVIPKLLQPHAHTHGLSTPSSSSLLNIPGRTPSGSSYLSLNPINSSLSTPLFNTGTGTGTGTGRKQVRGEVGGGLMRSKLSEEVAGAIGDEEDQGDRAKEEEEDNGEDEERVVDSMRAYARKERIKNGLGHRRGVSESAGMKLLANQGKESGEPATDTAYPSDTESNTSLPSPRRYPHSSPKMDITPLLTLLRSHSTSLSTLLSAQTAQQDKQEADEAARGRLRGFVQGEKEGLMEEWGRMEEEGFEREERVRELMKEAESKLRDFEQKHGSGIIA